MANQKEVMLDSIKSEVKEVCKTVAYLEDLFELQRELSCIGEEVCCPYGLALIEDAIYDSSFMTLAKMVDRQAVSIYWVSERLDNNSSLFDNDVSKMIIEANKYLLQTLADNEHILVKIKKRRDKIIVHNDRQYFTHLEKYDEIIKEHELYLIASIIKAYLDKIIAIIGLDITTEGIYTKNNDFRQIITHMLKH